MVGQHKDYNPSDLEIKKWLVRPFGRAMREWRWEAKLSQVDVGNMIEWNPRDVGAIELGSYPHNLKIKTIVHICFVLHINMKIEVLEGRFTAEWSW